MCVDEKYKWLDKIDESVVFLEIDVSDERFLRIFSKIIFKKNIKFDGDKRKIKR